MPTSFSTLLSPGVKMSKAARAVVNNRPLFSTIFLKSKRYVIKIWSSDKKKTGFVLERKIRTNEMILSQALISGANLVQNKN